MAIKNTIDDVRRIIETELEDTDIASALATANAIADEVVSGESYSDMLLKKIEVYLAAHFIAIKDPQISREKVGDAEVQYDGKTGMGLEATKYGQQVLILDHHGKFAKIAKSKGPVEFKTIM